MERISCILVDDEPLALELLERYVKKTPFLECKFQCSNGIEALSYLEEAEVDLIFLDIQMPELSGLELSRIITKKSRIVFTTAFNSYALDGFRVNALDYLLKPFNYDEFLRAANRAREWYQLTQKLKTRKSVSNNSSIFVKTGYKLVKIDLNDIICFEGLKDYIKIHLSSAQSPILTLMSLKALEGELPPADFLRIHRSFIIALNKITKIEKGHVEISGGLRIAIAGHYRERIESFIKSNSVGQ
jgi:DNA-binding LytR/AlgR family response regulator